LHGLKHESEVDEGSEDKLLTNNSPFCYAISYWLGHARAVPTGAEATPLSRALWQLVADFFWGNSGATFAEWRRVHPTVEIEDAIHRSPTGHKRCGAMIGLSWGPLHLAASYGLVDVLDWAHPEGIDFNVEVVFRSTPLWEATASGEESAVAVIVTKDGVDVNISNGLTPLIIAARDGHVGIVEILLRQVGINVDKVSSNGYSALDLAIKGRNEEIVRLLLEHGAKREKLERKDLTILGDLSSVKLSSSVGGFNS